LLLLAVAGMLGGCRREPVVAAPTVDHAERWLTQCVPEVREPPVIPSDSLGGSMLHLGIESNPVVASLARTVPGGWGGFTTDSSGRLLVRLVDTTRAEAALAALRRLWQDSASVSGTGSDSYARWHAPMLPTARVVPVRFSMAQLFGWMTYITWELHSTRNGPVELRGWGLDDRRNSLIYVATDSVAQRHLEDVLGALGLPCGLVRTSWGPPIRFLDDG
ncbi:MAG TPA: hypothetical protein VFS08_02740, partial [Gemmatimonadaceae bacterium]|nr:hypothetical protein [Gemmatimonadaceae bacterium]